MSKIVGATVGTPLSPRSIKEKLKLVTSVNGATADENGNVEVAGGVTSWNDLTDKPFYSEFVEGVAEFNGDLTGKEYYDLDGQGVSFLVKMSDTPLSMEELLGSTITVKFHDAGGDTIVEFISNENNTMMQQLDESNYIIGVVTESESESASGLPVIYVIHGDLSSGGVPYPEGTYFAYLTYDKDYVYAQSLSCLSGLVETVKPLDKKYLPDSVVLEDELAAKGYQTEEQVTALITNDLENKGYQNKEQVTELIDNALEVDVKVSYEDLTDVPVGKFRSYSVPKKQVYFNSVGRCQISSLRQHSPDTLGGEKIYFDGKVYDALSIRNKGGSTEEYIVGNPSLIGNEYEDNGAPIAFRLTWINSNSVWSGALRVYTTEDNYETKHTVALFYENDKQLDEKYIPDTIAKTEDIPEVPTKLSELENDAGFITADDIPEDSGGVTSWNDLTDKPFGEEKGYIELWAETTTSELHNGILPTPSIALKDGDRCRYTCNGVVYETQIIKVDDGERHYFLIGGNPRKAPTVLSDNGEPLAFWFYSRNKTYFVSDYSRSITFSAEKIIDEIKCIDKKYLPDSVVLEDELTTKGYQTEAQVTELINNALGVIENGTY